MTNGSGTLSKTLHAASAADIGRFSYLLEDTGRKKLAEHHSIFAIFYRPFRSNFTRVQRLSIMMSITFLTMITSAMFYRTDEHIEQPALVQIGPFTFGVQELFVSAVSLAIIFPVNLIIIILFRKVNTMANTKQHLLEQLDVMQDDYINPETPEVTCIKDVKSQTRPDDEHDTLNGNTLNGFKIKMAHDISRSISFGHNIMRIWSKCQNQMIRILVWTLVFLSVVAAAFFVVLYSLEWGAEKANKWFASFVLSILETILLLDPLKVIIFHIA